MMIYGVALPATCTRVGFITLDNGLPSNESQQISREAV
ncbi:hypothetical protein PSEMO_34080 [Pseudomonas putida]|uniref:Uncharacterized protein n=1 Tax=Pseudomonas putida TaxID=303 RepID=A0A1Q9R2V9_PSEPU|nr:hypothetical protein PSEMO_34080 [Pseudomonas putida]